MAVSDQTGGFVWSYPLTVVPGVGGPEPDLELAYSSQDVDGRTADTNTQGSWIGDGLGPVARLHRAPLPVLCTRHRAVAGQSPNNPYPTGDQCWCTDNATMSLNGRATELVKAADGTWKGVTDDGSRIERLPPALGNGDNDGEYWKVTTTDGTQYFFGRNRLPGWTADTADQLDLDGAGLRQPPRRALPPAHLRRVALHAGVAVEPRLRRRPARQHDDATSTSRRPTTTAAS